MAWMIEDRLAAGLALADRVAELDLTDPVVLALPRGGVPVAAPVAARICAPLDLILVRKIGMPGHAELAAGAVVDGAPPQTVFNARLLEQSGLSEADFTDAIRERQAENAARRKLYLAGRAPISLAGRSVVVVDDGIATGATVKAALAAVRKANPHDIVLAIPVAPRDVLSEVAALVDHVICLAAPEPFHAVGLHYRYFGEVKDDRVVALLAEAERNRLEERP